MDKWICEMRFCHCTLPKIKGPECCKYCGIGHIMEIRNLEVNDEKNNSVIYIDNIRPDDVVRNV